MNKKIFTLIAGLLLSASVSVNAQTYATSVNGTAATEIVNGKYYQLGNAANGNVLTMEKTLVGGVHNGQYHLEMKAIAGASLPNSMWKATVSGNAEAGISYTFTNVATGLPLGVDPATAVVAAGGVAVPTQTVGSAVVGATVWKWQPAIKPAAAFTATALTSAFKTDSAVTLIAGAAMGTPSDVVTAVKYAIGNPPSGSPFANQVVAIPVEAGAVLLGVDDLNSMLWKGTPTATSRTQLTFDKDVEGSAVGNLFTKNTYRAVKAVGFPADYRTVGAPQTPVADYSALQTAEINLVVSNAQLALANAVKAAVLTNGVVDAAKLALAKTAMDAVAGAHATIGAGTKATIPGLVQGAITATDATSVAVENAIVAYSNTMPTDALAQGIATGATAGVVYTLSTTNITTSWTWAAGTTDAAATANIKTEYIDKATTGTTACIADQKAKFDAAKLLFDGAATIYATNGWVSLMSTQDASDATENTYLAVDTKFLTEDGGDITRNLGFAIKKFEDVGACDLTVAGAAGTRDVARLDLNGRYNFQFYYYPSSDSIVIRTGGWAKKRDTQANWKLLNKTTNPELDEAAAANAGGADAMQTAGTELNLIKIAILADKHREVTVGNSELKSGSTPPSTINTRIYIGGSTTDNRTTLASGLYFLNLSSNLATRSAENGGYKMVHLSAFGTTANQVPGETIYAKEDDAQRWGSIQNFAYMPATQWVVEKTTLGEAGKELVNIYNREYPSVGVANVQLYTGANGAIALPYAFGAYFAGADTLKFSEVKAVKTTDAEKAAAYNNEYLGYFQADSTILSERFFNLDYLSGIALGNLVNVSSSANDTILRVNVDGEKVDLVLETAPVVAEGNYGYNGVLAPAKDYMFPQLRRTAYVLKVKDSNKLANDSKYVVKVGTSIIGEPVYAISSTATKYNGAAVFFLKENNRLTIEGKSVPYYALVDAVPTNFTNKAVWNENFNANNTRMGVKDGSLYVTQEAKTEKRVAAFRLLEDNTPLYRRLGVTDPNDGFKDNDTNVGKIYRINSTEREYLYEDAWSKYSTVNKDGKEPTMGINFLGVEGKGDAKKAALFVDTAYVRAETNMPQYMLAVRVQNIAAGKLCPYNELHNSQAWRDEHNNGQPCADAVDAEGYRIGDYLINAIDSVKSAPNGKDYQWETTYTRLAFVTAKHISDTLIIYRNGKPSTASVDSIFLGDNLHNKTTAADGDHRLHKSHKNGIKNPVFAFRLIDDEPQADFLIESEGDHKIPSAGTGGWIKVQNGVPVIARLADFSEAIKNAEKFNIETTDEAPVSNETISTTGVEVVAVNGAVIVKNAANKKVAISNILGKTLANTVIKSDEATFTVPAGIVVVAVEGEEAVKAVVK